MECVEDSIHSMSIWRWSKKGISQCPQDRNYWCRCGRQFSCILAFKRDCWSACAIGHHYAYVVIRMMSGVGLSDFSASIIDVCCPFSTSFLNFFLSYILALLKSSFELTAFSLHSKSHKHCVQYEWSNHYRYTNWNSVEDFGTSRCPEPFGYSPGEGEPWYHPNNFLIVILFKTCRSICQVTHERLLWLSLLEQQRKYLPLPYDLLHSEDPHLPNHPTSLLESLVIQTQRVADYWPRPRNVVSQKLERKKDDLKLMGVEIFLDRWLVVAYSGGAVYLYDIHPTPTPSSNPHDEEDHQATVVLRSCLKLNLGGIWSYVISFDSIAKKLFLALGRSVP